MAFGAGRFPPVAGIHDAVLNLIQILFDEFEEVVDAVEPSGTVPEQVFFFICQKIIRAVDRKIVARTFDDEVVQPFTHDFAFPTDYGPVVHR